jgi:hypothetical protein
MAGERKGVSCLSSSRITNDSEQPALIAETIPYKCGNTRTFFRPLPPNVPLIASLLAENRSWRPAPQYFDIFGESVGLRCSIEERLEFVIFGVKHMATIFRLVREALGMFFVSGNNGCWMRA